MMDVLERAKHGVDTAHAVFWPGGARLIEALSTELATLRAKVAELEKDRERLAILDAHRTRWYLDQETDHATYFSCFDLRGRFHTLTELADALIDAAMAQGERTNGD